MKESVSQSIRKPTPLPFCQAKILRPLTSLDLQVKIQKIAEKYFTGEGITDNTIKTAIVQLITDLIGINSIEENFVNFDHPELSKTKVIYPFPGTGALNILNLLNPINSDGAFRLSLLLDTPTISSKGVNFKGTVYGNSHFNPLDNLEFAQHGGDVVINNNWPPDSANLWEFGCVNGTKRFQIGIGSGTGNAVFLGIGADYESGTTVIMSLVIRNDGHWVYNKIGNAVGQATIKRYSRVGLTNVSVITGEFPDEDMQVNSARNPVDAQYLTDRTFGWLRVGDSISGAAMVLYRDAVDKYQYALGRLNLYNINYVGHSFYGSNLEGATYHSIVKYCHDYLEANGISTYDHYNISGGGWPIATLVSVQSTITGCLRLITGVPMNNVMVLNIGLNDLSVATPGDTVYAALKSFVETNIALGYKVFVYTCTPFGANLYEAARQIFNNLIRYDLALNPNVRYCDTDLIPEACDQNNTTYFNADKVHPIGALKLLLGNAMGLVIKNYYTGTPITIPADPSNLAVVVEGLKLRITWDDNADNEVVQYLERSTTDESSYAVVATLRTNIETYLDTTVGVNTKYYYRLRARNSAGYSSYCASDNETTPTAQAIDLDGNYYHEVVIGTQTWLIENLKTTKYKDGSDIALQDANWGTDTTGQYNWPNANIGYKEPYGALYNFGAVVNAKGLGIIGYHIPTNAEYGTLAAYLASTVGKKLKEAGTTHWSTAGGDNSSGFTAVGAGSIGATGTYAGLAANKYYAWFWTKTTFSGVNKYYFRAAYNSDNMLNDYTSQYCGHSIRLLKD